MKRELLSPVGNMEMLKMAVANGCDAVYLGGKKFGARAYAANFTKEELKEAVFYCHMYGVKLYVTLNTMIYESELQEALNYLSFLYKIHVDAVIMSDLGLMRLSKEKFPDLEIHASTQCHTHNTEQLKILKELNVGRVVLAREVKEEDVHLFARDMEVEIFIHGALCISYSGQCLFSSLLLNRSGNRGECAQICRLPFELLKNGKPLQTEGKYLLSTKDLNTSSDFQSLLKLPITSFKIEGRMKSPSYVGYITKMYRRLIDDFEKNGECTLTPNDEKNAAVLFNRGFTKGRFFKAYDEHFMNQKTSNHQGILLGKVSSITKKQIQMKLDVDLTQGDGIRFLEEEKGMIVNFLYDCKGKLIHSAKKGDLVYVDNKVGILKSKTVLKTMDHVLEESILKTPEKKIPVSMKALVNLENGFQLSVSDGEHEIVVKKNIVFEAKNMPIMKEKIVNQLGKLGGSPFCSNAISVKVDDNVFVNIRDINEIRREAIEQLICKRVTRQDGKILNYERDILKCENTLGIYASVKTEEQLKTLLSLDVSGIYVDDYELYQKYREQNHVIFRTNRVNHLGKYPSDAYVLAGETGAISKFGDRVLSTDYFLNVANHASIDFLWSLGVKRICLSPEVPDSELKLLISKYPYGNPIELLIYGRLEVMVLDHCLLRMNVKHEGVCKVCKCCDKYALRDRNGAIYPIWVSKNHRTHIFYHSVRDVSAKAFNYYEMGISNFRLDFVFEDSDTIKQIVKQLKNALRV